MWWLAEAQSLHQVSDRLSSVYVERCHIDRAENAVVFVNKERTVRLPAAFIATLLLGPGTRITHAAVRLLADSGTAVSWVGEHGVRMYAHGLGPSRGSQVIERQAYLVSRPQQRLSVARKMYGMRFPGEDVSTATMQQLLGREGARIKRMYRENSDRTGVQWDKRAYVAGDAFGAGDDVNRLLSAGNSCMYGICHAAVVGVGASPALGFVHTGHSLSFVLDIADLYKAEYSIPLAFDLTAKGQIEESDMRWALRDRFRETRFMSRIVKDIMDLLMGEFIEPETEDNRELWAGKDAAVRSGHNWGLDADDIDDLLSGGYLSVSGPEIPDQADW